MRILIETDEGRIEFWEGCCYSTLDVDVYEWLDQNFNPSKQIIRDLLGLDRREKLSEALKRADPRTFKLERLEEVYDFDSRVIGVHANRFLLLEITRGEPPEFFVHITTKNTSSAGTLKPGEEVTGYFNPNQKPLGET